MWWDSLNHILDHTLLSITGTTDGKSVTFLFVIVSAFDPGSGPTEATAGLSDAFEETPLKLPTLHRGNINGLDGCSTPGA